jgi:hypothetical protein
VQTTNALPQQNLLSQGNSSQASCAKGLNRTLSLRTLDALVSR